MESVLPQSLVRMATSSPAGLADFDALAGACRPAIFRFVLASLHDPDAAETITQECLFKAYQARSEFRGEASVRSWMMRIAINMVRNHLRNARLKFWRRTQRHGVDAAFAADWLADEKSSPEEIAATRQRVVGVWNAAARLPGRQRTVFLLRFGEDMELPEIAAATGMQLGTVKTHLFRAVNTLRERIEEKP
jgi:RNA polymerase sigma-70 factor, ECF subfamily